MSAAANRVLGILTAMALTGIAATEAAAQQYGRIDFGWSRALDASIRENDFGSNPLPIVAGDAVGAQPGTLNDIGAGYVAGIGIGTRLSPQFRVDVTYTYRGGYELDESDKRVPTQDFKADITSQVVMASVYYDAPFRLGPVTPYVGGGIGFALNKTDNFTFMSASAPGATTTMPGGSNTEFAWQLMTGLSVELTRTWTLELGYRYVDLGRIEFDPGNQIQSGVFGGTTPGMNGNLSAHELMASVRFGL